MSNKPLEGVVSHWGKLVTDYWTSPQDFYGAVERALERHQLKALKTRRVEYSEGGVLTPDRQYLRVSGPRHDMDICAAHFGADFFFSEWVTKRKPRFVAFHLALILTVAVVLYVVGLRVAVGVWQEAMLSPFGLLYSLLANPLVMLGLVTVATGLLVALWARQGYIAAEDSLRTVPLLGWLYEQAFCRETYYRIDTMLMFQTAVHATLLEVIDELLAQKGRRALTEAERHPVYRELVLREEEPALV